MEFSSYPTEILIGSVIILWLLAKSSSRLRYNLPPSGSLLNHFPILGYIPFVDVQTFHKQVIEQGPIVRYKFGPDDVIIVNDYDLIKEASTKDEFQYRPRNFLLRLIGNAEILVTWNGKLWRSQRNFSLRTLRTLGFGKSKFEGRIHDEMKYMMDKIDEESNEIRIKRFLGPSVSNVIMLMTIGKRYDFDHPVRQTIDKIFLADRSSTSTFFTFFSIGSHFTDTIRFLINLIPTFIIPDLKTFATYLPDYLTEVTRERQEVVEQMSEHELSEQSDCFIDAYLKHTKIIRGSSDESHQEEKKYFTEDNGRASAQAFFAAGSATTKDAIEWILALLAANQDVQEKVFQEVEKVVGSRQVSINDKNNLPIMESVIFESLRIGNQIPLNLPHCVSRDTTLGGYDIPKGTHIMTNFYGIHTNPKYWPDPEKFKYDRFLSEDRTKCIKSDYLMPFGYGKRSCPGESMAMLEMFLYAATIVQKYKILPGQSEPIKPFVNGIAYNVNRDLKLKLVPRT